jgi:hypothetical protein
MMSWKKIEFKRDYSCLLNGAVNVSDKMASYIRMDSEYGCLRKTPKISYKTGVLRAKRLTVML